MCVLRRCSCSHFSLCLYILCSLFILYTIKIMLQNIVTILYVSGDVVLVTKIATLLETTVEEIEKVLTGVDPLLQPLGLALLRSQDSVAVVSQQNQATVIEKFWKEELKGDLTPAALQVLTLVAYLDKGTREEISYIRGVQSAQSIRALTVRGLISRNAEVCSLTSEALKHLGITSIEELPDYKVIQAQLREKLDVRIS